MSVADLIPGFGPTREVKANDDGTFTVIVTPPAFMKLPSQHVTLNAEQYKSYLAWRAGGIMIQDAFPFMSAAQREILQSGIGPDDRDRMFKEEV